MIYVVYSVFVDVSKGMSGGSKAGDGDGGTGGEGVMRGPVTSEPWPNTTLIRHCLVAVPWRSVCPWVAQSTALTKTKLSIMPHIDYHEYMHT